jgi:hypothetical protein
MKKYWQKFKIFWLEIGNILTNIACPVLSILAALFEVLGVPVSWIQSIKKAEYWCWQACGTKSKIDNIIDIADEIIEGANNNDYSQG